MEEDNFLNYFTKIINIGFEYTSLYSWKCDSRYTKNNTEMSTWNDNCFLDVTNSFLHYILVVSIDVEIKEGTLELWSSYMFDVLIKITRVVISLLLKMSFE